MADEAGQRIGNALEIIERYGGIDGEHHKTWVIDRVVAALLGSEVRYQEWLKRMRFPDGPDGDEYDWDPGIAP